MKNWFLKYFVKIRQKRIPKHPSKSRILIVSTTGLGDTLWATAAIENIRKTFPHCYLAVLTSPIGFEALQNNPHINQLFTLKEPLLFHFFSHVKRLYMEKFDTVLLFHASQRLTLPLVSLIGASRVIGTANLNKGLDCCLTETLPNICQHEIVRRLKIAEKIGAGTSVQTLSFYPSLEQLPRSYSGPWIALHPGSKDAFKRWPEEKFIELGCRLKKELSCNILITGTQEEEKLMERIAEKIPEAQIDTADRSLRAFAALLAQMDLLISNDTGPVHLACALKLPVIAIYSSTDPALCGPHQAEKGFVISRKATCEPCLKRKCRRPFCFLQIGVDEVLTRAKTILM
jgi:ADP-heptose:LPS heptosyltransferase